VWGVFEHAPVYLAFPTARQDLTFQQGRMNADDSLELRTWDVRTGIGSCGNNVSVMRWTICTMQCTCRQPTRTKWGPKQVPILWAWIGYLMHKCMGWSWVTCDLHLSYHRMKAIIAIYKIVQLVEYKTRRTRTPPKVLLLIDVDQSYESVHLEMFSPFVLNNQ